MEVTGLVTAEKRFYYQEEWDKGSQKEFKVPQGTFVNYKTGHVTLPACVPLGTEVSLCVTQSSVSLKLALPSGKEVLVTEDRMTGSNTSEPAPAPKVKPSHNYLQLRKGWKR